MLYSIAERFPKGRRYYVPFRRGGYKKLVLKNADFAVSMRVLYVIEYFWNDFIFIHSTEKIIYTWFRGNSDK